MSILETISLRRSIRRFKAEPVSDSAIHQILTAATLAPSAHNRQPWRFVVVRGAEPHAEMARVLQEGLAQLAKKGERTSGCAESFRIMESAPVNIFVFNPYGKSALTEKTSKDDFWDMVNTQSIGAAIQNMLLTAQDLDIGSLWIGDIYGAYDEICAWLGEEQKLIAAVALGYPDETPGPRPRKTVHDVTRWL